MERRSAADAMSVLCRATAAVYEIQSPALLGKPLRRPRERIRDRMALGFYITGKGFTQEKYDTTLGQLEEAGAGAPDGTHLPRGA